MTERQRIRAIQDEYERETGERPSRAVAAALVDQHADAEYQRRAGGAYDLPNDDELVIPSHCSCAVSRVYGGDCAHTAPEAQDDYEPENLDPAECCGAEPGAPCRPWCVNASGPSAANYRYEQRRAAERLDADR